AQSSLEAADEEVDASPQRLELLAVVRGLEALEQPSRVTLMSASRYLRRGLQFGLREWRENDWQWERYGRMAPVKDRDLWQRLDRLVEIHAVECGPGALEKASDLSSPPAPKTQPPVVQRSHGGRRLRIDSQTAEPCRRRKSEIRSRDHCRAMMTALRGGATQGSNPKIK